MIALASILAKDRNALICDLAETYQIYDYRRVPGKLLGILTAGLGPNTRIGHKVNGVRGDVAEVLLAQILDGVRWLCWAQTEDAKKGRGRPQSVASDFFVSEDKNKVRKLTVDEFENIRKKVTGGEP